jgi:hypothetical protein
MSISPSASCDATSTTAIATVYQLRVVVHGVSPLILAAAARAGRNQHRRSTYGLADRVWLD